MLQTVKPSTSDFNKFRLRRFVERLIELGEVVVHEDPIALAELLPMARLSLHADELDRLSAASLA